MAKISLISPYESIVSNGLRIVSSYLKNHGHHVDLIFLVSQSKSFAGTYSENVVQDIIKLCARSDLIGFSISTNYFLKAADLTQKMKKKIRAPIIWGGIHPTVEPEESLDYADMVCLGEGEEAMLELAAKIGRQDIHNIRNIWLKRNGSIIRNMPRPLEQDLDRYPFQDYDITNHYILIKDKILKMTDRYLEIAMICDEAGSIATEYQVMGARGCSHNCTYCSSNALRKLYSARIRSELVRFRTPTNLVEEIESVKKRFPFIRQITINDDTFFIRSTEEIRRFCSEYKHRVGLPLRCNVSPTTLTDEKLCLMIDAGLSRIEMGVQSYNEKTLRDIYGRLTPKVKIKAAVDLIGKYKKRIPQPSYHIIADNPYETNESIKENIDFVAALPNGARVEALPLVMYPGTDLYKRALRDKIIKDKVKDVYLKSWAWTEIKTKDYLTSILIFSALLLRSRMVPQSLRVIISKFLKLDIFVFIFDNKPSLWVIYLLLHAYLKCASMVKAARKKA